MTINQFLNSNYGGTLTYETSMLADYNQHMYLIYDRVATDKMVSTIWYMFKNYVLLPYDNFEMIYNTDYTYQNTLRILFESVPELVMTYRKNQLALDKLLDKIENLGSVSSGTNQNTMSYSGLNVQDNYQVNNGAFTNNNINYLNALMSLDIDFKKVLNIMKDDFEKLVQVLYNI